MWFDRIWIFYWHGNLFDWLTCPTCTLKYLKEDNCNDPKFSTRANTCGDTRSECSWRILIRVYTVCYSVCIFLDTSTPRCSDFTVNFLNIRTPKQFVVITLNFELCGSTIRVMSPNNANSVDPDQTAPLGAVWSGSTLFAQAYLSENLRSLW